MAYQGVILDVDETLVLSNDAYLKLLEHQFTIQDRGEKNRFFRRDVALQRLYSQRELVILPKRNRVFAITESML
ncbi:hypothetical protein [Nostoc sp. MG11]|uniref:hypothetical protein n=1 Tax=Nostoc sp. MG11 TaxID=2721166 RepID=UPI001866FAAB|nr:hypothetical protein [Nostoc sp. MG11]